MSESFSTKFLKQTGAINDSIDFRIIENIAQELSELKERDGRLFFIGSGGGAGHASHAVNDFRKIANIECYSPSDNVSELTARINDDGWDGAYASWLKASRFNENDALFVFSVGGGSVENNISLNLVECMKLANEKKSKIFGIVGRDGGFTKESSDLVVLIPTIDETMITPHTEGWQAVIWHLLVSHPKVLENTAKWESTK
jgi:D-sedoheptulose 7-phosphate isomerase